ncbi:hypothetical protein LTR17_012122 [Elasticomyces elasticus]|nr:hypothetical protein LTR17_012122 [Elasticomyces elasticus]
MAAARSSTEKTDIEDHAMFKENIRIQAAEGHSALLNADDADFLADFPDDRKKALLRKVDWHLVPMLLFLYLITYIDKVNIGNAKIEGMSPDLKMSGYDYNVALSIFFIPYILAEGVVMTCTGLIDNFGELIAVRFLLGLFEAGLFPGALLLISRWYMPNETQTRMALLYTSAASGGAFSGLLAYGIAKMDGVGGYDGWRWAVVTDWKVNLLILANWSQAVPNYALKFSMPTIMKGMGYQSANAQLLTIPPYFCGAISSYVLSVFADRYMWRLPFLVGPQLRVVVGYAILFAKAGDIVNNIPACYFAVCLACFGLYPILPAVNAWNVSNCAGPTKRAISIAYLICMGNVGGLVGSYIYKESEAPRYPTGYGVSLAFAAAGIVAAGVLEALLIRSNKRNARRTEEEVKAQYTDSQLYKMGDRSPLYKYQL